MVKTIPVTYFLSNGGFVAAPMPHEGDWAEWLWHVGLDWEPSKDTLIYGKTDRGYKSGGFGLAAFAAANFNMINIYRWVSIITLDVIHDMRYYINRDQIIQMWKSLITIKESSL